MRCPFLSWPILGLALLAGCGIFGDSEDATEDSDAQDTDSAVDASDLDDDSDGLTNAEEAELGTDPNTADSDSDGILDADEVSRGTNPTSADTDGDGFLDADEISAGSDPVNRFSWDYDGGVYPDFSDQASNLIPTGWGIGDTIADVTLTDQFGAELSLHQFYGHVIVVTICTEWAGPCVSPAQVAQSHWASRRDEGLMYVYLLAESTDFDLPNTAERLDYAQNYDLTFPVVVEPEGRALVGLGNSGLFSAYPTFVIIDQEMTIRDSVDSSLSTGLALELAEELLDDA